MQTADGCTRDWLEETRVAASHHTYILHSESYYLPLSSDLRDISVAFCFDGVQATHDSDQKCDTKWGLKKNKQTRKQKPSRLATRYEAYWYFNSSAVLLLLNFFFWSTLLEAQKLLNLAATSTLAWPGLELKSKFENIIKLNLSKNF